MAQTKISQSYNKIAKKYHALRTKTYPHGYFFNELLEMPTTLSLLGNVRGKKILDVGCGTGIYAKVLRRKGAIVDGIDISKEMIKIAQKENPHMRFRIGSAEKLPYRNSSFDIVLSALAMEYLKNWGSAFQEVRRVLKRGGMFVFSTGNPVVNSRKNLSFSFRGGKSKQEVRDIRNYFDEGWRISKWKMGGLLSTNMRWHHKTYGSIVKAIVKNGFELIDYEDAKPLNISKKLFPSFYGIAINMPYFCTWKVRKK